MSLKELVDRRTGRWINIHHNSSPLCSGELKIKCLFRTLVNSLSQISVVQEIVTRCCAIKTVPLGPDLILAIQAFT